jgi:CRISPR-associated DxTHG motif protein
MPIKNTTLDNSEKKKALITILGIQGGFVTPSKEISFTNFNHKANYYFEKEGQQKEYFNTLPLLIEKYQKEYQIIPVFTDDAKLFNQEVLNKGYQNIKCDFDSNYHINDEKDFNAFFALIDNILSNYDEVIVDVSHGFRHLPILMIVDIIIHNFQNSTKIQKILFAKEIQKHEKEKKGLYEMIDLKKYLDLANIAFVLTAFGKNYTVSSHIKSYTYVSLIESLNNFSNDIMALNLNNLFKNSSKNLIRELSKIQDVSISKQALELKESIEKLTNIEGKKRYQTYLDLSKDLFEKNYMLLSLALLFESIRMYIKTVIKKEHKELVEKVENTYNNDLYKIGDFFKNLSWKKYDVYKDDNAKKQILQITKQEYESLKTEFDNLKIKDLYDEIDKKRNNLAHANANGNFQTIQSDIKKLLDKYQKFISPKSIYDLKSKFEI